MAFSADAARVDVAVPCYRYAHLLCECVDSVLGQKGVEVRVLILDDASPDDTLVVATALSSRDGRVLYRRHEANRGHIATFNEGIDWAEADYFLLLSADDVLTPGSLARATGLMERHPDVGVVFGDTIATTDPSRCGHELAGGHGHKYPCLVVSAGTWIESFCLSGLNIAGQHTSTAVVRTGVQRQCGHYRAELPHAGDMEMWLRLAMYGSVGIVMEPQAYYRQHDSAMHHRYSPIMDIRQRKAAFDSFFAEHGCGLDGIAGLQHAANRRLAVEAMYTAGAAFGRSEPEAGTEWLRLAREIEPQMFAEKAAEWKRLAEACAGMGREVRTP